MGCAASKPQEPSSREIYSDSGCPVHVFQQFSRRHVLTNSRKTVIPVPEYPPGDQGRFEVLRDIYHGQKYHSFLHKDRSCIPCKVEGIIKRIVENIKIIDERFEILETINVGSFYEGTQNNRPDEFDFVLILSRVSNENTELEIEFDSHTGEIDVKVLFTKEVKERWGRMVTDNYLHNFKYGKRDSSGLLDCFRKVVEKAVEGIGNSDGSTASLKVCEITEFGPAVTLLIKLDDETEVSIDITVAIRYGLNDLIKALDEKGKRKDVCLPDFIKEIEKNKQVLVITKSNGFRLSFVETEIQMVKSLRINEVIAYRLLKYFMNGSTRNENRRYNQGPAAAKTFSSYDIKLFILKLHFQLHEDSTVDTIIREALVAMRDALSTDDDVILWNPFCNLQSVCRKSSQDDKDAYEKLRNAINDFLTQINDVEIVYTRSSFVPIIDMLNEQINNQLSVVVYKRRSK